MKGITLRTGIAIGLACGMAGCQPESPDVADRGAKKDVATQPTKPVETFESSIKAPPAAGSASASLTADNVLSEKVKGSLSSELRTGGLEVSSANGVVTIYGTVEDRQEKERAALLAMDVEGVRSVVNNLVVLKGS